MNINSTKVLNRLKRFCRQLAYIGVGILLLSQLNAMAATHYVDGSMPSDSGDGTSWVTAKKYITSGIGIMSGGDTLIVRDGIYSGSSNRIANLPSGSAGAYTKIQAETDFGVVIQDVTSAYSHCYVE